MKKLSILVVMLGLMVSGGVEAGPKRAVPGTESGGTAPVSTPVRRATASAEARPAGSSSAVAAPAKGASSGNSPQSGGSKGSLYKPTTEFADPTPDSSFKKLMSLSGDKPDPQVALSFLNAFVPDFQEDPLVDLTDQPLNLPQLPAVASKRVWMDFHARTRSGIHINIEMQVAREKYFDERALFYAAGIFVGQIKEPHVAGHAEWEGCLRPAYGVHILGYDSNALRTWKISDPLAQRVKDHPLPAGEYIKHYRLEEAKTGQIIRLLQLIQIELPRVTQVLFPPRADFTAQEWWLSLLKHYDLYTEALMKEWETQNLSVPDYIKEALRRLRLSSWSAEEIEKYGKEVLLLREHATELAQEREQAFLEGEEKGREEGVREYMRNRATTLRTDGKSDEKIAKRLGISVEGLHALFQTSETISSSTTAAASSSSAAATAAAASSSSHQ